MKQTHWLCVVAAGLTLLGLSATEAAAQMIYNYPQVDFSRPGVSYPGGFNNFGQPQIGFNGQPGMYGQPMQGMYGQPFIAPGQGNMGMNTFPGNGFNGMGRTNMGNQVNGSTVNFLDRNGVQHRIPLNQYRGQANQFMQGNQFHGGGTQQFFGNGLPQHFHGGMQNQFQNNFGGNFGGQFHHHH